MDTLEWLLDSDPSIRWQVMRDLTGEPPEVVAAERSKVASQGWGAALLALQDENGSWGAPPLPAGGRPPAGELPDPEARRVLREAAGASIEGLAGYLGVEPDDLAAWETTVEPITDERFPRYQGFLDWAWNLQGTYNPKWISTTYTLLQLRDMGIDPADDRVRRAVELVRENSKWEHDGQDFFAGEVEPCVNGMAVAIGSYFGQDVDVIVQRLLGERMTDGGWNCEMENGSTRSSFDTTINVLEGLAEYERSGLGSHDISEARAGAEEYMLERRLFRRLSNGEVVDPAYTEFAFPPRWHYDVLRGLDYFRTVADAPDPRCDEALDLVADKRQSDGRWLLENTRPGEVHFEMESGDGQPSRWNTLRASRVLAWAGR